jgi:uncharacterized protein (TIGR01777 family)
MKTIVVAGGTGLIGKRLVNLLRDSGYKVNVLSRKPKNEGEFHWDPRESLIDESAISDASVFINLSGAGIADEKWTHNRKLYLQQSRVGTNVFLYGIREKMPKLEQFICASGINAYGFKDPSKVYVESDPYGGDFVSQLVKVWELSAEQFKSDVKVATVRTAIVLDGNGGALQKMVPIVKKGIGSALGSGEQMMPWIHTEDLVKMYLHIIEHQLEGPFNALASATSNKDFMHGIAKVLHKPFWFPKVPGFVMRMMYGEMSIILLNGIKASNEKINKTGFSFQYNNLEAALKETLQD